MNLIPGRAEARARLVEADEQIAASNARAAQLDARLTQLEARTANTTEALLDMLDQPTTDETGTCSACGGRAERGGSGAWWHIDTTCYTGGIPLNKATFVPAAAASERLHAAFAKVLIDLGGRIIDTPDHHAPPGTRAVTAASLAARLVEEALDVIREREEAHDGTIAASLDRIEARLDEHLGIPPTKN